jgi:hypothetical protein
MRPLLVAMGILLVTTSVSTLSGDAQPFDETASDLALYVGQLAAVIDRASEAAVALKGSGGSRPCATLGADWAIKDAALQLAQLRNQLSTTKISGLPLVPSIRWPTWALEPPACTAASVIRQRIDWVEKQMGPMTDPVCERASKETGDSLICSVE